MRKIILQLAMNICAISCFGQNLNIDWANIASNGSTPLNAKAFTTSSALDASNNFYNLGTFSGSVDFNPIYPGTMLKNSNGEQDIFIQKTSSTGQILWTKSIGGNLDEYSGTIVLDQIGNIVITGNFKSSVDFDPDLSSSIKNSVGENDCFILKLTSNGAFIWVKTFETNSSNSQPFLCDVDFLDNIYLTKYFKDSIDVNPSSSDFKLYTPTAARHSCLVKLTSSGDFVWGKSIGSAGFTYIEDFIIGNSDDIYLTGIYTGTTDLNPGPLSSNFTSYGGYDFFVLKINLNGEFEWVKTFGSPLAELTRSLKLDSDQNIIIAGQFSNSFDADPSSSVYTLSSGTVVSNGFVIKLSNQGDFIWANNLTSTSNESTSYYTVIDTDENGNIFVGGGFQGNVIFQNIALLTIVDVADPINGSNHDCFIQKLNNMGQEIWVHQLGGDFGNEVLSALILDPANDVFISMAAGSPIIHLSSNDSLQSNVELENIITAKFNQADLGVDDNGLKLSIYPNPVNDYLFFNNNSFHNLSFEIVDMNMKTILTNGKITQNQIQIENIAPGIYFLVIQVNDKIETIKFIKQ